MKFQRGRQREEPEINLIPMIDVLLVILIFLMVTTTYSRYAGLEINLPSADASKPAEEAREIDVVVTAAGQVQINRQPVAVKEAAGIADAMRRAAGDMKDPLVVIHADAKATHQSVINVMQAAQIAGYPRVSFATKHQAN